MAALAADLGVGRTLGAPSRPWDRRCSMTENDRPRDRPSGALETVRALFGSLDLIIGILLAAMLLPLVLGPIVVAYQFAQAGQYVEAGAIALLAATWYVVGGRAVMRGAFGPATVFSVLGLGAIILFVAIRFRR